MEPRKFRRPEPALAGDEFVAAVRQGARQERLQYAVIPDGFRQLLQSRLVEVLTRLGAVRLDLVHGELDDAGFVVSRRRGGRLRFLLRRRVRRPFLYERAQSLTAQSAFLSHGNLPPSRVPRKLPRLSRVCRR